MLAWQRTHLSVWQVVVMLWFWAFSPTLTIGAVATASEPPSQIRSDSAQHTPNSAQTSTSPEPTRGTAYREDGWVVFKGERRVLWMNDEPGTVMSIATLPPGVEPMRHPFLTARSIDAFEEDTLSKILNRCHTFAGFVTALESAGYTVVPGDETNRW